MPSLFRSSRRDPEATAKKQVRFALPSTQSSYLRSNDRYSTPASERPPKYALQSAPRFVAPGLSTLAHTGKTRVSSRPLMSDESPLPRSHARQPDPQRAFQQVITPFVATIKDNNRRERQSQRSPRPAMRAVRNRWEGGAKQRDPVCSYTYHKTTVLRQWAGSKQSAWEDSRSGPYPSPPPHPPHPLHRI